MAVRTSRQGVLAEESREQVIDLLTKAYWMEVETVMSYLAASVCVPYFRRR
jgi:bacterioferritin